MKFTDALLALADTHSIFSTHVPYSFAAEYVNSAGMLDYTYFTRVHKVYGSSKDFGKAVREVFGDIYFTFDTPEGTVTKEDFLQHYEFGKFPRVVSWIPHLAKVTGKILLKEDLMAWVYEQAPEPRANYAAREVNKID